MCLYQKTLINFWSITGLCSGLYIGYNKNKIRLININVVTYYIYVFRSI